MTGSGGGRRLSDAGGGRASAGAAAVRAVVRPRPELLPITLAVWVAWAVPVVGVGVDRCFVALACLDATSAHLVGTLGVGLPATYLTGAALTSVAERVVRPADRFPAVFDPPRRVRNGLLAVVGSAGLLFVLAGYGALYSAVGAWLVVFLYAPVMALTVLFGLQTSAVGFVWGPGTAAVWTLLYLATVAVQVGWWYVLAHGAGWLSPWR